jgi:hypothetical protein
MKLITLSETHGTSGWKNFVGFRDKKRIGKGNGYYER